MRQGGPRLLQERGLRQRVRAGGAIQRCAVHELRNILRKVSRHAHDEVVADFHLVVYASGLDTAGPARGAVENDPHDQCDRANQRGIQEAREEDGTSWAALRLIVASLTRLVLSSWALYDLPMNPRRGDYGYDAPPAFIGLTSVAILATILAVVSWMTPAHPHFRLALGYAVVFGLEAAWFYYGTRHGKFRIWEHILDGLKLQGSEHVLDMGCGRGAVLNAVARRSTTGKVTGVDLWRSMDQSGNSADATMANARAERVADRVAVETADMRKLPFADNTFDVIVSSLAIHNIPGNAGRAAAVTEAMRVLKPGGRLAIADVRATSLYARTLRSLGATAVVRRRLGWRFWYGIAMTLVTATKVG
jgi:arsenite methyltransferase